MAKEEMLEAIGEMRHKAGRELRERVRIVEGVAWGNKKIRARARQFTRRGNVVVSCVWVPACFKRYMIV